jgi:hypothetical protein
VCLVPGSTELTGGISSRIVGLQAVYGVGGHLIYHLRSRMAGFSLRALYALLAFLSLLNVLCAADAVGDLQTNGRAAIDAAIAKSTTCTKDKVRVRREW